MKTFCLSMLLVCLALLSAGCTTGSHFKIPKNTKLQIADRHVTPDSQGRWETSPFFWDQKEGADYYLYDEDGRLIRRGKLRTEFRAVSIVWPPLAFIYWPMGLTDHATYDLTAPSDGVLVVGDMITPTPVVPATPIEPSPEGPPRKSPSRPIQSPKPSKK